MNKQNKTSLHTIEKKCYNGVQEEGKLNKSSIEEIIEKVETIKANFKAVLEE